MQFTAFPPDFFSNDFAVNDAPTLILDSDPTEDTAILVTAQNIQSHQPLDQEKTYIALELDSLSHK